MEPTALEDSYKEEVLSKPFPEYYHILDGRNQHYARDASGRQREPTWSTEYLLSQYVSYTDRLIGMLDGTIPIENASVYGVGSDGKLHNKTKDLPKPQAVIYLDKSARPVEWFVRSLWEVLAREPGTPYEQNKIPEMPSAHFVNIDKKPWLKRMGFKPEDYENPPLEEIDFSRMQTEDILDSQGRIIYEGLEKVILRLRAVFSTKLIDENDLEEARSAETIFDGKHVLIVDETRTSGASLKIAQMLFSIAFPKAVFSTHYWSYPSRFELSPGQFQSTWAPVWYDPSSGIGRGVSDIDEAWIESERNKGGFVSQKLILGRSILSTPSHESETGERYIDAMALSLRREIKQVAEDLKRGLILYNPIDRLSCGSEFTKKDAIRRIQLINGISIDEWREKKNKIRPR